MSPTYFLVIITSCAKIGRISVVERSSYDPKIVTLLFLSLPLFTWAFKYHTLLKIIVFSQPLFSDEIQCSALLRDSVIHLLRCYGK